MSLDIYQNVTRVIELQQPPPRIYTVQVVESGYRPMDLVNTQIHLTQPAPRGLKVLTLSHQNILDKNVDIGDVPQNPNNVVVTPTGGPVQVVNLDYSVQNNILSWDGLGLDTFLEAGDVLVVQY